MPRLLRLLPAVSFALVLAVATLRAQTPSAPPAAVEAGWVSLFDGHSLAGWEGDPKYWRAENGCLVGEVTPETLLKQNTFIIWRAGTPADFELKVEYRVSAKGNSGVNYRSTEVPGVPFALRGYQADIDGPEKNRPPLRHTGQNYEERGRTFLARRGELVRVGDNAKPAVIGSLGDSEAMKAFIKNDDWNELHIIARGTQLTHLLNGHVMAIVLDDDVKNRRLDGLLGVQVHVGPPMKVEFRNFLLKTP